MTRILLEGPPFDGVCLEWPIERVGLPLQITFSYVIGQEHNPNPSPDRLSNGERYPIRYRLMFCPATKDGPASYVSEHDITTYRARKDEPEPLDDL